jgi:hypothetical protein
MSYHGLTFGWIHLFTLQLLTISSGIIVLVWRWKEINYLLIPLSSSILSIIIGLELVITYEFVWTGYTHPYWGLPLAIFSTFFLFGTFLIRSLIACMHKGNMVSRIREVMMKKIWRTSLFSLIIITLGVSIMVAALVYTPRLPSTISVVLGTGHLIDGYHVVYGESLEARWIAQDFRLSSDGSFMLDLRCDYLSENPKQSKVYYSFDNISTLEVDLDYLGSVVLVKVEAVYEMKGFGDFAHGSLTEIIPIVPEFTDSKSCVIEYEGVFSADVDVTKVMNQAYGLGVQLSWIRIFIVKNEETLYYQWMQGGYSVWGGEKLEVDKTYSNISGGFLVYYPTPESVTSPLHPYEFDYVKWIKENM